MKAFRRRPTRAAGDALRARPLQMGIVFERASVEFWDSVLADSARDARPARSKARMRTRSAAAPRK
jgi:hypothetical protein